PAPPAPGHTAWMSHSCSSSDMAGTSTPYPHRRAGPRPGTTGHRDLPGARQHQGPRPGLTPPSRDRREPAGAPSAVADCGCPGRGFPAGADGRDWAGDRTDRVTALTTSAIGEQSGPTPGTPPGLFRAAVSSSY